MTYYFHSHLHLPLQVLLYGPLHMVSCFPFKGFFKICHGLFFGTRAIGEQIIKHMDIKNHISFITHFSNFTLGNNRNVHALYAKLENNSRHGSHNQDGLECPLVKSLEHFSQLEQSLIKKINPYINSQILTSSSVIIDKISIIFNFNIY